MMDGFIKLKGKQTTGQLLKYEQGDVGPAAACALGCILVALGLEGEYKIYNKGTLSDELLRQLFDDVEAHLPEELFKDEDACDCDSCRTQNLHKVPDIIIQLNDEEGWTIPQISNWLYESLGL